MTRNGPRILTIDIETLPGLFYGFSLRQNYIGINQLHTPDRMGCFAAKWYREPKVHFYSEFHHGRAVMLDKLFDLMDEADVVSTYNGDNFDLPWIQRELHPRIPAPSVSVDLYKVGKKNFRYLSHKLAYITEQLNLSGKMGHEGFELWVKCHAGDPKAWNVMRRYCKQDVVTQDELLTEFLPYVKNMPAASLFDESLPALSCDTCQSPSLQRRGWRRTKTRRYPRYQCQNCGHWMSGTHSDLGAGVTS